MKIMIFDTITGKVDLIHNVPECCSATELLLDLDYDINGIEFTWLAEDFTFEDINQYKLKPTKEKCFGF